MELTAILTTDPDYGQWKGVTLLDRFWQNVKKRSANECWEWIGTTDTPGYGMISSGHNRLRAHRLSFEIHCGPIPAGKLVCHTCDNRLCVNPSHLWIGSSRDNAHDARNKGRLAKNPQHGMKHGMAKLTDSDIVEIRSSILDKKTLAQKYGVHYSVICKILRRANWKHI